MESFTTLTAPYAVLPISDIDTDQIIPARFLKVTDKAGLGHNLFHDWRYLADGSENPDFVLNQKSNRQARILVAGDNFGCGSSREHAPWALVGLGFRAVISTRFADIFSSNSYKNGLLPVVVSPQTLERLMNDFKPGSAVTVDLSDQTLILPDGSKERFPIDPFNKTCLLQGIDQLGYLLQHEQAIADYESRHPARISLEK